jgi:alpha-beta hydrolase superfamily lysophospholipase
MTTVTSWTIPGALGETILGDAHVPPDPIGVMLIAHGFKGYKDYGMFPFLAARAAEAGFIAHRFNFSHSGMTGRVETFERPDLFERDTWNRQVEDLRAVVDAIGQGTLAGGDLPLVLFGHSRGGVAVLLAAGRAAGDPDRVLPAAVITAAAPSCCNTLAPDEADRLLAEAFIESPSARTGQALRVGRAYLQEQIEDPAGHDLPAIVARLRCPLLVVHGTDDPTVPATCAGDLTAARGAPGTEVLVAGADHVFNTPNPMPADAAPGDALRALTDAMLPFAREACRAGATAADQRNQ